MMRETIFDYDNDDDDDDDDADDDNGKIDDSVRDRTLLINQSINFIDERVKTTTDIVTKISTN